MMPHRMLSRLTPILAVALAFGFPLAAAADSPDDVLVQNAMAKLTRADYDAELARIPADKREEFATSPKRLTGLLNNVLIIKTLAAEARASGIDKDPAVQTRIANETDRVLAVARQQQIEEEAAKQFEANIAQFTARAQELYTLNPQKYQRPEAVNMSHILFDTKKQSAEQALALANETRAKLLAGADFATLARQLSDDPTAQADGGNRGWSALGKMEPPFKEVAAKLKEGEVSEPVLSKYGYHLIRVDGHRPARQQTFDEVKSALLQGVKTKYVAEQLEIRITAIRTDPHMKVNQEAVDALVVKIDPERMVPSRGAQAPK